MLLKYQANTNSFHNGICYNSNKIFTQKTSKIGPMDSFAVLYSMPENQTVRNCKEYHVILQLKIGQNR